MIEEMLLNENLPPDAPEPLPFPFNQRTFCRYEPIEKRIEQAAEKRSTAFRSRIRSALIGDIRREVAEAGAGTAIPQFNQNTKQRRA